MIKKLRKGRNDYDIDKGNKKRRSIIKCSEDDYLKQFSREIKKIISTNTI